MMRENKIPPQPHSPLKLNPVFPNLKALNVTIAQELLGFKSTIAKDGKRRVLVNSFDAAVSRLLRLFPR